MSISLLLQAIFSGLTNGFIYALVGMGVAVTFKGSRVVNAAQGEFSVLAALVAVFAMKAFDFSYPVAFIAGIAAGMAVGVLIELLLVRPMVRRHAGEDSLLLLTIGIAFAASAAFLYFGGRDFHVLPSIGSEDVELVLDAAIRHHAVWLMVISVLVVIALRWFYHHTTLGLAMMAASIDPVGAATTGINVGLMRTLTFSLGGLLGSLAGLLIAPLVPVTYTTGLIFTLKGFCAAILGGLGNPIGAVLGGLTLGLLESLSIVFIASATRMWSRSDR